MAWLLLALLAVIWLLCMNKIRQHQDKREAVAFTVLMLIAAALIAFKTQDFYGLDMLSHWSHLTKIS